MPVFISGTETERGLRVDLYILKKFRSYNMSSARPQLIWRQRCPCSLAGRGRRLALGVGGCPGGSADINIFFKRKKKKKSRL
jgi:hypothetical protein